MSAIVRRRFIRVAGRGVHYLRAGDGPPVVLLHSAIRSADAELALLQALAGDHSVFAFDHPGFGDSDALPGQVSVEAAADALAQLLAALDMPGCPVYGSHTGATVAIELARRHPARVSALILNGVPAFDPAEAKLLGGRAYCPLLKIRGDGRHLFATWVKARDAATWFPWYLRKGRNRRVAPFPPPAKLHDAFVDSMRGADTYAALYQAVFVHDFDRAVRAIAQPATFLASRQDILFPHLDRLPPLKPGQVIVRDAPKGMDFAKHKACAVRAFRVAADAPREPVFAPSPGAINRRYVDIGAGQLLVRSGGEALSGRPLVLLHDGRASSRVFEPLMRALMTERAVFAIDLPDNGASSALSAARPAIGDYADAVAAGLAALGLADCDIHAVGASSGVALELAARPEFQNTRLLLEAPDFYPPQLVKALAQSWVPPLEPEWDGAHLSRLWLMLRDEHAYWPWFDKSPAAACALDTPSNWREMHARVVDILRSLRTYHRLPQAALDYDWQAALNTADRARVTLAATMREPRRAHVCEAARLASLGPVATLPTATGKKAGTILRLLEER